MANNTANAQMSNQNQVNETAANTNSVNGAKDQMENMETRKTTRRRKLDPMQDLNTIILKKYLNLPSDLQNCETKRSCINAVLASHKDKCGDTARYYGWILSQAPLVRRTFDFKTVCDQKGLTTEEEQQAVAEHLVIDGKAVCTNIRLNGLASFPGNIKMYRERLVPEQYRFDSPVQNGTGASAAETKEGANA